MAEHITEHITEDRAVAMLKMHSCDKMSFRRVLLHSRVVQKVALRIADEIDGTDKDFISTAALLHDIGRLLCRPGEKNSKIRHGIIGAEILRKEGLPMHALAAERHIGVGISKKDIIEQGLDLPKRDFLPLSKEEKILAHADNLVFGEKEGTLQMVIDRFSRELGPGYVLRVRRLAIEIDSWKRKNKG